MAQTPQIAITGNTYPVKDQLRALGGRWDGAAKAWMVPADRVEQARQLVAGAHEGYVAASSQSGRSSYRPHTCRVCGARAQRDARGYATIKILRSGECVDCYEERRMGY